MSVCTEQTGYIPPEITSRMDLKENRIAIQLGVADCQNDLVTVMSLLARVYLEGNSMGITSHTEHLHALSPTALRVLAALICTGGDGIEDGQSSNPVEFPTIMTLAGGQPVYYTYVRQAQGFDLTTHSTRGSHDQTSTKELVPFMDAVVPITHK